MAAKKKRSKTKTAVSVPGKVTLVFTAVRTGRGGRSARYRGYCSRSDFSGPVRETEAAATADALKHQRANPTHVVGVETA